LDYEVRGRYRLDLEALKNKGKKVIDKESETRLTVKDWELWGTYTTSKNEVFVYRKIVTFEEAEQHELENELLN